MNFWNVSQGKDVRINLEYNLAMSEVLGRPGWLYNETKALHDEGAILSCSGDSPFQLRLLKGVSSDVSCLSKMCLYVSDPADILNPPVKQTKKDTAEYKKEMEGRGVILPSTVDYATGRRTELIIDINECIPKDSLIFLKSTFNTCPDLLHMVVRSVESDLKLHVDSMLLLKDHAAICRLECNITERNVKPPRFKFEIVEKLCKAVSLSFRDAEVIISDCNRISDYGRSDCPIFEGVYSFETPHVYKADQTTSTTSYNVLISLVDGFETSFTKGVGISVRKLADLQFQSLYQLLDLLRQREFKDIQKCKDLYEIYYQSTLCLFGDRAFTLYKLKLDILLRLFEKGELLSPFYYMTEGTEKSHHTAAKDYNTKTMRDGGNDAWNMSSSYLDIQFSFYRAIDLCSSKSSTLESYRKLYGKTDVTKTYLEICCEPIPEPELDYLRTEDMFRGMHFVILGTYGHLKETQASLEKKITENGGNVVSNVDIINRSKLNFLSHHYCILPNRNCIDAFIKGQQGKEKAATKALFNTILGNWIYLNAEFVIACVQKKSLIDPKGYVFEVDESARAKFKTMKYISMAPQLQRQSNPLRHGSLTYHTAMRKYKNALKKATLKRKLDDV